VQSKSFGAEVQEDRSINEFFLGPRSKAYLFHTQPADNLCHPASWRRPTFEATGMDVLPIGDGWQGRKIGEGALSEIFEVILPRTC